MWYVIKEDELYHHGIKGQKWGVRRFQNPDGTLTDAGRKRLYKSAREGKYGVIREAMSDSQKKRIADAARLAKKAEDISEKAADRFHEEHANRVMEKLGPNYNVETDVKKAEKVWNEELFKNTPERRAMLDANKSYRKADTAFEQVGEEVAKELLGKYANKTSRSLIYGKEQMYVSLGRKIVSDARLV